MSALPLRIVWGCKKLTNARWRLGLFALQRTRRGSEVVVNRRTEGLSRQLKISALCISLRGLLIWSVTLGVTGYFATAVVLYSSQRRQPYNQVTFADIVLPWRWSGLDALRGQTFLARADEKLKAGDLGSALPLLRIGVAKLPTDWKHRLLLVQIYTLMRAPAAAHRLLFEGFEHAYPGLGNLTDMQRMIGDSDSFELQDRLLKLARETHARENGPPADLHQINTWQVQLLLQENRVEEAVALAREAFEPGEPILRAAMIRAALARDDKAAAWRLCEEWAADSPDKPAVLWQLAEVYAETGRQDALNAVIRDLRDLRRLDHRVIGRGVQLYVKAGMDEQAGALLEDGFLWFSSRQDALESWLPIIATTAREDYLMRIAEVMSDHGFDTTEALLWRLHVQILGREWERAAGLTEVLQPRTDKLSVAQKSFFSLGEALVNACIDGGGGTQQQLAGLFRSARYRISSVSMTLEALLDVGRLETAREIVTLSQGQYPDSSTLAALSKRIDARVAEIGVRPAPVVSPALKAVPADAEALLGELDKLSAADRSDEALRLISVTRRQAPSWWDAVRMQVARRELTLLVEAGDLSLLQLRLREFLREGDAHHAEALQMAVRWHESGRTKAAILAVREILKQQPDDAPALAQLKAWTTVPTPDPEPVSVE